MRLKHGEWASSGNVSSHPEFAFMMDNGPWALFNGYVQTQDAMVQQAVGNTQKVNFLQLVLLIVEGAVVCTLIVSCPPAYNTSTHSPNLSEA